MKFFLNLGTGIFGTLGALKLPELAAVAAGLSTAIWMLTQTALAIRAARRKDQNETGK